MGDLNLPNRVVMSAIQPRPVPRFREDAPLNAPDPKTFYGVGPEGYTDYPTMEN